MLRLLTSVLIFVLLAPITGAKEPKLTRLPIPDYLLKLDQRTEYYGLYMEGHKIGWWRSTFRKGTFNDKPALVWESEGLQSVINSGEVLQSTFLDQEFFNPEPPYEFIAAHNKAKQAEFDSTIDIEREGSEFVATVIAGHDRHTRRMGAIDYTFADIVTTEAWCRESRSPEDELNVRNIDWEKMIASHDRYSVSRVIDAASKPDDPRYEIKYQSGDDRESGTATVAGTGIMLQGSMSGVLELRLEPEEQAKKVEATYDMFEASLIEVDRPIGNPATVTSLVLDIVGPHAALIPSGGMQKSIYDKESTTTRLTITSKPGMGIEATEEEVIDATKATFTFPSDDPKIKELAEKAVGKAKSEHAKVQRLVDFVDTFVIDDIHSEPPTVHDIIRTRRGDCTEHSTLFVTLARSLGIPTREVNGFVYGEGSFESFGGHAWCEVAIDGKWLPVDPTWGETTPNATHIRISSGPAKSDDLKVFLGGLKIKVVSIEHKTNPSKLLHLPSRILNTFRGG